LNFLSGLPSIMAYGILFAVLVFAIACGWALMKTNLYARHAGPPQLEFRNPARRPRRPAQRRNTAR
jgi:hypothetical protein